jgi:hypothetical protein
MNTIFWGAALLAVVLAIWTGWRAVPLLSFALTPWRVRYWFLEAEAANRIMAGSQSVQARLQELRALGFTPLGVKMERVLWRQAGREVALVSTEAETFASIVLTRDGRALSVYFYTPLSDGGLVFTRAESSLPVMESRNTSVKNVAGKGLDKLLASHRLRLRTFRHQGLKPAVAPTQAARLAATRTYYASTYARRAGRNLLKLPVVRDFALTVLLLGVVAGFYLFRGFLH